jgi:protein-arginine kinase activator protein McsA
MQHAKNLEFEKAAAVRDQITEYKQYAFMAS